MAKENKIRFVTPQQRKRIERWARRKPVFALMGEFSAGKSTLLNFLVRKNTLPTQVTATQLPPVWFSWGNKPAYVVHHDGSKSEIDLQQLDQVSMDDAQFIRIFLKADILEAVDLIDTPGISDPKISSDVWERAVGQANGVIWCTHSTQAWRETERATWVSLPDRLHHNSLLLVTRADALNAKDRQKVLRRVNREAGHLFNRTILFSAKDAIIARDHTGDSELWMRSGGSKMIDSFLEITESIVNERADMLARYQVDRNVTSALPTGGEASAVVMPVRPTRVQRRTDEGQSEAVRSRIDTGEADRLREEVSLRESATSPEVAPSEDELRSVFRLPTNATSDTSSGPSADAADRHPLRLLQENAVSDDDFLSETADSDDAIELETSVEFALAEESREDTLGVEDETFVVFKIDGTDETPAEDHAQLEIPEPAPERVQLETITLADTDDTEAEEPEPDVVSSITALMAANEGEDEFEAPLGDADLLSEDQQANIFALPEATSEPAREEDEAEDPTPETIFEMPAGTPLNATAMWHEIVEAEELPDDAEELLGIFQSFLEDFDQAAAKHNARQMQDALHAIPGVRKKLGSEWHVL